jgi:hypothetical protein
LSLDHLQTSCLPVSAPTSHRISMPPGSSTNDDETQGYLSGAATATKAFPALQFRTQAAALPQTRRSPGAGVVLTLYLPIRCHTSDASFLFPEARAGRSPPAVWPAASRAGVGLRPAQPAAPLTWRPWVSPRHVPGPAQSTPHLRAFHDQQGTHALRGRRTQLQQCIRRLC